MTGEPAGADRPAAAPPGRRPAAVAHRGAPWAARENTLPSFRAAVAAGADAVELDVRLTRDGVPVVLHDRTLERLWGHDAAVGTVSRERLTELAPGVPALTDALAATRGVRTLVDLPDPGAVAAAVAAVRAAEAADRVYYCGGPEAMRRVRAVSPGAELALTWERAAPVRPTLLAGCCGRAGSTTASGCSPRNWSPVRTRTGGWSPRGRPTGCAPCAGSPRWGWTGSPATMSRDWCARWTGRGTHGVGARLLHEPASGGRRRVIGSYPLATHS